MVFARRASRAVRACGITVCAACLLVLPACGVTTGPVPGVAATASPTGGIVLHFALCPGEEVYRVQVGLDAGESTTVLWRIAGNGSPQEVIAGSVPQGFAEGKAHPEGNWPSGDLVAEAQTNRRGGLNGIGFRTSELRTDGRLPSGETIEEWRRSVLASPGFCS